MCFFIETTHFNCSRCDHLCLPTPNNNMICVSGDNVTARSDCEGERGLNNLTSMYYTVHVTTIDNIGDSSRGYIILSTYALHVVVRLRSWFVSV